jgi:hypothetical protein
VYAHQVAAKKLPSAEMRTQFGLEYGRQLLKLVWEDAEEQVQQQLTEPLGSHSKDEAPDADLAIAPNTGMPTSIMGQDDNGMIQVLPGSRLLGTIQQLLDRLQAQGYMCG